MKDIYQLYKLIFGNCYLYKKVFSYIKGTGKKYDKITHVHWICTNGYFSLLHEKLKRNEKLYHWSPHCIDLISTSNNLNLLIDISKILPDYYFGCNNMVKSATNGHLGILIWLHENKPDIGCTNAAMDHAAANGHFEVVKYLHVNRKEGCTNYAMDHAAANGHLEIIKYLHENRDEGCTSIAIESAALLKDHKLSVDIFKFLIEHKRIEEISLKTIGNLGLSGNIQLFEYLYREKKLISNIHLGTLNNCCLNGNSEFLDHLLSNETLDFSFLDTKENLSLLATIACQNAHLNILEVLDKHGKIPNIYLLDIVKNSQYDIVRWLFEKGYKEHSKYAMDNCRSLESVKYFHENSKVGCTKKLADCNFNNPEILSFLFDNRVEGCSTQCFRNACEYGCLESVHLIASKYPSAISYKKYMESVKNGHLDIAKYLEKNKQVRFSQIISNLYEMLWSRRDEAIRYFFDNNEELVNQIRSHRNDYTTLLRICIKNYMVSTCDYLINKIEVNNCIYGETIKSLYMEDIDNLDQLLDEFNMQLGDQLPDLFYKSLEVGNIEIVKILIGKLKSTGKIKSIHPIATLIEMCLTTYNNGDIVKLIIQEGAYKGLLLVNPTFLKFCESDAFHLAQYLLESSEIHHQPTTIEHSTLMSLFERSFNYGSMPLLNYLIKYCKFQPTEKNVSVLTWKYHILSSNCLSMFQLDSIPWKSVKSIARTITTCTELKTIEKFITNLCAIDNVFVKASTPKPNNYLTYLAWDDDMDIKEIIQRDKNDIDDVLDYLTDDSLSSLEDDEENKYFFADDYE
ncbi:hypothetical protein DLAC_09426 [Tieghemostelium lacteum]|uniref:Uncharacterized protein n=1 Tax=Tieghemostelium lacteum TaxID=361077 RepID=A0A151ZA12_TIELA|nr:hypothetical protein DLAC_09426 [Tieghemostelium lacteum]|eukprot:KYQ90787.1 hypothetical protein DLAC_09426 [Tieghemostelium lacteum]